jgi:hypothetical protein
MKLAQEEWWMRPLAIGIVFGAVFLLTSFAKGAQGTQGPTMICPKGWTLIGNNCFG